MACLRRAVTMASNPIAPITAARNTLGEGRARTTNPINASAASATAVRGPSVAARASRRTAPRTIATLAPETAVRCDNPAVAKSARRAVLMLVSSPTTSAGSNPAALSDRAFRLACANCSRMSAAVRCTRDGGATAAGGPVARSAATVKSGRPGAATTARALTSCPGSRRSQPSAGAKIVTAPPTTIR